MIQFDLKDIGVIDKETKTVALELFNTLYMFKEKRCTFKISGKKIIGGYGILERAERVDAHGKTLCIIKHPKDTTFSIYNEAVLQYISYMTLKKYGLEFFIPQVYDIFKKEISIHFSMQYIAGCQLHTFLLKSLTPERDFIYCLLQLSIALYYLSNDIHLDHRDLRYANVFVVAEEKKIHCNIAGLEYSLTSPFHICLLDFGFACIGKNTTIINASEGIFHDAERCSKPGRDLFQLLCSLWSIQEVRYRMSNEFQSTVDSWFTYKDINYSSLAKHIKKADWSYVLTSEPSFTFPPLLPENLIKILNDLKNKI
jgi:serine/threonine protein kinase